jgi:hypothetical protein
VWSRNLVNEEALAHWGGGAVAPKQTKTVVIINPLKPGGWFMYRMVWHKTVSLCPQDIYMFPAILTETYHDFHP